MFFRPRQKGTLQYQIINNDCSYKSNEMKENIPDNPKAMILAAGKGTRLRPLTDSMPKALVQVNGGPLIRKQIEKLKSFGFEDITVNAHHFADMLYEYIRCNTPDGVKIKVSFEKEKLLNTGGALRKATEYLLSDGYYNNVLVHNVDILSNVNLKEFYVNSLPCDAKLLVSDRNSSRRLLFEPATLRLVGWTNLKTGEVLTPFKDLDVRSCKSYSFSGIHVISPQLLKEMCSWPEEFSIIDFYLDK